MRRASVAEENCPLFVALSLLLPFVLAVTIQRRGMVTLLQYCTPYETKDLVFVVVIPLLLSTALLLELSPSQIHRVHRVFLCVEGSFGCVCVCV